MIFCLRGLYLFFIYFIFVILVFRWKEETNTGCAPAAHNDLKNRLTCIIKPKLIFYSGWMYGKYYLCQHLPIICPFLRHPFTHFGKCSHLTLDNKYFPQCRLSGDFCRTLFFLVPWSWIENEYTNNHTRIHHNIAVKTNFFNNRFSAIKRGKIRTHEKKTTRGKINIACIKANVFDKMLKITFCVHIELRDADLFFFFYFRKRFSENPISFHAIKGKKRIFHLSVIKNDTKTSFKQSNTWKTLEQKHLLMYSCIIQFA